MKLGPRGSERHVTVAGERRHCRDLGRSAGQQPTAQLLHLAAERAHVVKPEENGVEQELIVVLLKGGEGRKAAP